VGLFFALSGFLITRLMCVEEEAHGSVSLGGFYARRAIRILPPAFGYLGAVSVLTVVGVAKVPWGMIGGAGIFAANYLRSGWTPDAAKYLFHLWSLSMEEQFYLVWPVVFALAGREWAKRGAITLIAFMPVVRVGWYFAVPGGRGDFYRAFHLGPDRFLFGCILALCWEESWMRKLAFRIGSGTAVAFLGAVVLVGSPLADRWLGGGYSIAAGVSIRSAASAGIVAAAIGRGPSGFVRMMTFGPLRALGLFSYSLYLWQNPFLVPVRGNWALDMGGALACGGASYAALERPFLALRRRWRREGAVRRGLPETGSSNVDEIRDRPRGEAAMTRSPVMGERLGLVEDPPVIDVREKGEVAGAGVQDAALVPQDRNLADRDREGTGESLGRAG
jgi:peptidoglycan/LPS O-acetylase OafA/YrhL